MKLNSLSLVVGFCMLIGALSPVSAQTSSFRVASGLSSPLYGTFAPGDTDRMFLVEQGNAGTARIKVLDLNTNSVLASPFLTISGMSTGGERGLLGLAFDPDYANNGHFYIYGSFPGGGNHRSIIRRYSVQGDPATSNTADPASAFQVMSFNQPFSNHNGGWIGFNPTSSDPYLYIATGDGGSANDPQNNSQDITNNRLGKMLRIDVSRDDFPASAASNYGIPATNPFVGVTGDDEIWSYGLRNHWRNSFDRATGDLWIGDVGQNAREEINWQPADSPGGENWGWRVKEGLNCFDNSQAGGNPPCNFNGFSDPVYTYSHNSGQFGGFSVTGGYVYNGSVSQYEGLYFFADFVTNNIWTIDPHAENIQTSVIRRNGELPTNISGFNGISSFAEDADGEMYVFSFNGNIFRVESTARDAVWNGNDGAAGGAGDGVSWSDPNNWTRDGNVDTLMVSKDRVIFGPGPSSTNVDLQGDRSVGGMRVTSDYSFGGGVLRVLSGKVDVAGGATARINSPVGAENNNNALKKYGAGKLYVNDVAAQVAVLEGTLGGSGSIGFINVYEGGTVNPGDGVGQLNTDDFEMRSGSVLEIDVSTAGSDLLSVAGPAVVDGRLKIEGGAYTPAMRGDIDQFLLLAANSITGEFDDATYNGVALDDTLENIHVGGGLFIGLTRSSTEVSIYAYYALPGDANGDGVVDAVDFIAWNDNKFTGGTDWTTGDFDGNGITDAADFIQWNDFKFQSVTLPRPVPEPSAWALLLGCLALACRTRR